VLVQPTAVDTPFPQHARNLMDAEPKLPDTTMIDPDEVAAAIIGAAEKPQRSVKVGSGAVVDTALAKFVPGMADRVAARQTDSQRYDEPPRDPQGALRRPSAATGVVGRTHGTGGRERG
jgi:short-subunit dehydrogenase